MITVGINDQMDSMILEQELMMVTPQRREKALAFKHEQGRRLSVAAFRLLQTELEEKFHINGDLTFGYADNGKPFLLHYPQLDFSLSHCSKGVACAISDECPVGIDIERIRNYNRQLAERVLSAEELEATESPPHRDVAFIELWTRKEALLKMTGEGIRDDLRKVLYGPLYESVEWTTTIKQERGWICTIAAQKR